MTNWNRLKQKNDELKKNFRSEVYACQDELSDISISAKNTARMAEYAPELINNIDARFKEATKLNDKDIKLLFLAVALQIIRQYVLGTLTQRVDDKTAAKNTSGHGEEHSDRHHKLYHPSLQEIVTNPVPFDAIYGGTDYGLGIGGGFTHRAKTLGHDPILGWVFGTMNIATSTVTVSEGLNSYHVLTGYDKLSRARDKISKRADTFKVVSYSANKLLHEGIEGKEKVGTALIKEAIHLKSDLYSKASLPVPIISTISVEFARQLAEYGVDMGNVIKVGAQAEFSILINDMIAMIHGLYYDESEYPSWNVYSVKTRKILDYSNVIASVSNVIVVAIGAAVGVATENPDLTRKSINYLDIGGIIVTIYRLLTDAKFECQVEKEFLEHEWYNLVMEA